MPTFDFVDLPGIQAVPEDFRKQTEGLVQKYIGDSNTLVICVLEATDAALDKGVALKLLTDAIKLNSTIIALTKSDKVHADDIEDQIFKRILMQAETNSGQLKHLKACVAVANRRHQDTELTLAQAAQKEISVFAQLLHDAPARYQEAAVQQQLAARMTSKQLMAALNDMYHAHITTHWVREASDKINVAWSIVERDLSKLGPEPSTLDPQAVMSAVCAKVGSFKSACCLHPILVCPRGKCAKYSACSSARAQAVCAKKCLTDFSLSPELPSLNRTVCVDRDCLESFIL